MLSKHAFVLILALSFLGTGCAGSSRAGGTAMRFELKSTAFLHEGEIPKKHTCDGSDVSPALAWSEPAPGTKSLALVADDPDAPVGTWVHWVLFDLPPTTRSLPEGLAKDPELRDGSHQGKNDFGRIGYGGPCPPRGPAHRYYFRMYALDIKLDLRPGASRAEVDKAMKGHVLSQAELMGRYRR